MKIILSGVAAATLVSLALIPATASAKLVSFQSQSGNIGCIVDSSLGARCDIRAKSFPSPRKPRSCKLDYGQGLTVGKRGRGHFVCAGDTTLGSGRRVAYGDSVTAGRFTCEVTRAAVKCTNRSSHHGFSLARAVYLLR